MSFQFIVMKNNFYDAPADQVRRNRLFVSPKKGKKILSAGTGKAGVFLTSTLSFQKVNTKIIGYTSPDWLVVELGQSHII